MINKTRCVAVAAVLLGVVFSPLAVSAQSELDSSEATAFIGDWLVSLDTEFGAFDMDMSIADQDGKVAVQIASPDPSGAGGMLDVTDVSKSGESLVMNYDLDAQGQLITISVVLEAEGEELKASFDFGGQLFADGNATRATN